MGHCVSRCKWVLLVALMVAALAGVTAAAEFSAVMKETVEDSTSTSEFYRKDLKYRFAGILDGEPFVLIADRETGKTVVFNPDQKVYLKMKSADIIMMIGDPFQVVDYWQDFGDRQEVGAEEVSGYGCDKIELSYGGEKVITYWQSAELGLPLKVELHGQGGRQMELSNIKLEPIADSLFEIPEGYTKFVQPGDEPPEIPEWADAIAGSPLLTPPFQQELAAGEMLRIAVVPGKSIWVRGKSETESSARAIPFAAGRPLKEPSWYNDFAGGGVICDRRHESMVEADEIVVRVSDGGPVTVEAKYSEMHEKAVKAGEELRVPLIDQHITVRIVNLVDGESAFNWTYNKSGQEVSEDEIGPAKYRQESLDGKGDLYRMTWGAKGDELIISVTSGEVQIKLGQFDSFEF